MIHFDVIRECEQDYHAFRETYDSFRQKYLSFSGAQQMQVAVEYDNTQGKKIEAVIERLEEVYIDNHPDHDALRQAAALMMRYGKKEESNGREVIIHYRHLFEECGVESEKLDKDLAESNKLEDELLGFSKLFDQIKARAMSGALIRKYQAIQNIRE